MKKMAAVAVFLGVLGCQQKSEDASDAKLRADNSVKRVHKELYGPWAGNFMTATLQDDEEYPYEKRMHLIIQRIASGEVSGFITISGEKRAFKSVFSEKGPDARFAIEPREGKPGDGRFVFHSTAGRLSGEWQSAYPHTKFKPEAFELKHKEFKYDAGNMLDRSFYFDTFNPRQDTMRYQGEDGKEEFYIDETYRTASNAAFTINASKRLLTDEELKNLKKLDMEIIRNTIYARHGYRFSKSAMIGLFEKEDWYVPASDNVEGELTSVEKKNIRSLKTFEQYATDNYESFGR